MKQSKCPLCGERLKKGGTTCRCGYRKTLAEQELLRRLAVWSRVQALCRCEVLFGAEREEQAHG